MGAPASYWGARRGRAEAWHQPVLLLPAQKTGRKMAARWRGLRKLAGRRALGTRPALAPAQTRHPREQRDSEFVFSSPLVTT